MTESIWFLAPSNMIDCCQYCGLAIQPGEIIAECGSPDAPECPEWIHEDCYQSKREEHIH